MVETEPTHQNNDDLYTQLRILIAQMRLQTKAAEESAAAAEAILDRLKGNDNGRDSATGK